MSLKLTKGSFFTLSSSCSCSVVPRASSESLSVSAGFLPYYHCFATTSGMQIHRVGRYAFAGRKYRAH